MSKFDERIMSLFDKTYELYYIDYTSNLDNYPKVIEQVIRERCWQAIDELVFDWECDSDWGYPSWQLKELAEAYASEFGYDMDEAEEWVEENRDEIVDIMRDRDTSTPVEDLLRNTSEFAAFYELPDWDGCGETWCMSQSEWNKTIRAMRKALHIKRGMYERELNELLCNASYGGTLVVYFNPNINDFIHAGNVIKFSNPHVALIDTYHGSGHNVYLKGHEFEIDYDPECVFLDKNIKYNYTHAVCGMYSTWCSDTGISFRTKKVRKPRENKYSQIQADRNQDERYAKAWDGGRGHCSAGDMDISRHKNVFYINDFPCGMKCKECGTFWID